MAECTDARCAQIKRNIRRELRRWTRNMVHIVGLERIAEELMGRRKWKLYQESMSRNYLQPLNNNVKTKDHHNNNNHTTNNNINHHNHEEEGSGGEAVPGEKENNAAEEPPEEVEERLKDWRPDSKCHFCVDGKLETEHANQGVLSPRPSDSESTDSPSDTETPPTLTAPTPNHRPPMTTLESVTSMAALAAAFSGGGATGGAAGSPAPQLPPFYAAAPSLLTQNWYLANMARSFSEVAAAAAEKGAGEQPLDLSKGSATDRQRVPVDTKHIFKAKPRMSTVAGRRTYTEDELQAALRDIQSGKLGTRRAAVIYGIPRSTLRNKVYKLALERERESHLNSTPLKLDEEEPMDDDKDLSGAEEEKEVEKALQTPLVDILRFSNVEIPPEALKGLEHSEMGPYIQSLLLAQNLLQAPGGDLSKKRPDEPPSNGTLTPPKAPHSESGGEPEEATPSVILKIPSFRPSKNGDGALHSPPVTSDSSSPPILPAKAVTMKDVKDVIAQSISQKFQQQQQGGLMERRQPNPIELDFKRGGFTPPGALLKPQDLGRAFAPQAPPSSAGQNQQKQQSAGSTSGGKGTRPKRGKYRNYDRDSLVEAVRAVQRGEMSVHRAGSYYGVPHSTLEYKVKERHLMRPRKRDPKPNPVDEKIASLKQNDLRNSTSDKLKPLLKPPPSTKFPPNSASPNGLKLPGLFEAGGMPPLASLHPPPFPFWPHPGFPHLAALPEYARPPLPPTHPDFFASQMMQKLQEERQQPQQLAKNARQIAESLLDGSGTNGSFLDGIIRSSLESGVPPGEEKKEEKSIGVEGMSNKALLDQLCKNSRLTPLTKEGDGGGENLSGGSKAEPGSPIELSNDATEGGSTAPESPPPPARIYLKKELASAENMQPELLMRFLPEMNGGDSDSVVTPQD